jgi:AcrR family transcriptional regulator
MAFENLIIPESKPARADKTKNHTLLLQTAQRLFAERGVDAVTMTDIQEAAGVGKGTLYRHFENKTELCQALLDVDQRDLQERTLRRLRENSDSLGNLRWFLNEVLEFTQRNSEMLCVSANTAGSLQNQAHWWWRQTMRGLLTQLQPPGDIDYMADMLYILLDVHNIYFLTHLRGYSLDRVRQNLTRVIDQFVS